MQLKFACFWQETIGHQTFDTPQNFTCGDNHIHTCKLYIVKTAKETKRGRMSGSLANQCRWNCLRNRDQRLKTLSLQEYFEKPNSAYLLFYERSEELEPIENLTSLAIDPLPNTPVSEPEAVQSVLGPADPPAKDGVSLPL